MEQKTFPVKEVPMVDGYVLSFDLEDSVGASTFFEDFGFVVIRDVITKAETEASINDIWELIEASRKLDPISRDDPTTWKYWVGLAELGILSQSLAPSAWNNRVNPRVYKAFTNLLGNEKLWASVDNWGILRPTVGIPDQPLPPNKYRSDVECTFPVFDHPEYTTKSRWLHWDLNPFDLDSPKYQQKYIFDGDFTSENNGTAINTGDKKVQGLINLIDCREQDGGFLTVPGFHKHVKEWREQEWIKKAFENQMDEHHFVYVPDEDPMQKQIKKIPMKAGSLLVWHGLQPHCNYANTSNRFRMVQYLKMFNAADLSVQGVKYRRHLMVEHVPKDLQENELACKILGIKDYE